MAGGFVASQYPNLDEHEAYTADFRSQIEALRAQNAKHERKIAGSARKSQGHVNRTAAINNSLVDLEDRRKFVRIASDMSKTPKGLEPHEFYKQSNDKVRDRSLSMLSHEAEKFGTDGKGTGGNPHKVKAPPQRQMMKKVPSNFSSFQGLTEKQIWNQSDSITLGLRTTMQSGRRPGRLPSLLPRDSPHDHHSFTRHNAAYLARSGSMIDLGRSRARISELSNPQAAKTF